MQTQGTYVEQFVMLNKCGYYDLSECVTRQKPLKVAMVTDWWMDDKIEDLKHEDSKIRLECDDKLVFLSDVKALLLAEGIMRKLFEKQSDDVRKVIKKMLNDMEVE